MPMQTITHVYNKRCEHLHDNKGYKSKIHKNMEGPVILKSEVMSETDYDDKKQSNWIVIEMLPHLDDFGVDKFTEIIVEIYIQEL